MARRTAVSARPCPPEEASAARTARHTGPGKGQAGEKQGRASGAGAQKSHVPETQAVGREQEKGQGGGRRMVMGVLLGPESAANPGGRA
jgi:hypothetical protein